MAGLFLTERLSRHCRHNSSAAQLSPLSIIAEHATCSGVAGRSKLTAVAERWSFVSRGESERPGRKSEGMPGCGVVCRWDAIAMSGKPLKKGDRSDCQRFETNRGRTGDRIADSVPEVRSHLISDDYTVGPRCGAENRWIRAVHARVAHAPLTSTKRQRVHQPQRCTRWRFVLVIRRRRPVCNPNENRSRPQPFDRQVPPLKMTGVRPPAR